MLCTDRRHGRFFWGLDWDASRCSRKFCVAIADDRKRKFHRGPCDPRVECMPVRVRCPRVFYLNKVTLQLCYYKAQLQVILIHNGRFHSAYIMPILVDRI